MLKLELEPGWLFPDISLLGRYERSRSLSAGNAGILRRRVTQNQTRIFRLRIWTKCGLSLKSDCYCSSLNDVTLLTRVETGYFQTIMVADTMPSKQCSDASLWGEQLPEGLYTKGSAAGHV